MPRPTAVNRRSGLAELLLSFPRIAPLSAFLLAIAATISAAASVERARYAEQRQASAERIGTMGHDIERRTSALQAFLISGAALFNSGVAVDRDTFGQFVTTIERDEDLTGVLAIGWAETQAPTADLSRNRSPVEPPKVKARSSDLPGTQGPHVIRFISPQTLQNLAARGFDMSSEARRQAAIERAAQTRAPAITSRVVLDQDRGKVPKSAIVMFMPVYDSGESNPKSVRVRGFVYAGLRIDEYIRAALGAAYSPSVALQVFENSEAPDNLLLSQGPAIEPDYAIRRTIAVADRVWIVKSSAAPSSLFSRAAMVILLAELIIASLLAFVVRLAIQQAQMARLQLEVRDEQDSIRAILTRELNHRVKNALANVLSILALSRRGASDIDQFIEIFGGRVRALSATHNLLVQSSWSTVKLGDVVEAELAPFTNDEQTRVKMSGEDFDLAPADALSLGLLLHELATNAGKFGALSNDVGSVILAWHKQADDMALFEWTEQGGPTVPANPRRRFGSELIEKMISRQLKSDIKLEFCKTGVHCRFYVPVRPVAPFSLRQQE